MKWTNVLFKVLLSIFVLESAFAIHEYGHLIEFLKRGVPVEEFSLGIGPRLWSYKTSYSVTVSLRLLPIMAYVAPTEKGGNSFKKEGQPRDKIAVYTAGVRNNFLAGLTIVLLLQVLGWRKGNLSMKELVRTVMITPFKVLLRFVAFLVGCVTLGCVNLADRFLLSTGGVDLPKPLRSFVFWNLTLGLFNLAPIPPLDGGYVLEAILFSTGANIYIPEIPKFVSAILFTVFLAISGGQDMRVLEGEQKEESDFTEFQRSTMRKRSDGALGRWEEEGENAHRFDLELSISPFLSARVANLLRNSAGIHGIYGIRTVGDLREATANQLLEIRGFGPKSLKEVETFLHQKGLSLKPESID